MLLKIDSSVFLYRYKKMRALLDDGHLVCRPRKRDLSIYCFGRALGITQATVVQFFIVVPVCFIISSVPITPAGWGIGESVFSIFFGAVGVRPRRP